MWLLILLSCAEFTGYRFTDPAPLELLGACADDADAVPLYRDADRDGEGVVTEFRHGCPPVAGWSDAAGDCDDADGAVNLAMPELCNGVDDDCDFAVDESPERLWCADRDEDGFGNPEDGIHACDEPSGYRGDCSDCDDLDDAVHPAAIELAGDGIDNDCDGEAS